MGSTKSEGTGKRRTRDRRAYKKTYYAANREKVLASRKAYLEANREKALASRKAYYAANREKELASRKAYREANREKELASRKAYREANQEKRLLYQARFRAVKKGLPFSLLLEDITIPERCPLLNIELKRTNGKPGPNSPSLDRLIPALGYTPENTIVISYRANQIKSNATLQELKDLTKNLEKILTERLHTRDSTTVEWERIKREAIKNRRRTTVRERGKRPV